MKKSRYTDEQIAFALRQAETGTPVAEVIRKMGIAEQTFYNWKRRYGGQVTRQRPTLLPRLKRWGNYHFISGRLLDRLY